MSLTASSQGTEGKSYMSPKIETRESLQKMRQKEPGDLGKGCRMPPSGQDTAMVVMKS